MSNPVGKSAWLFDLDGTLIDSIELLLRSMEFAFDSRQHRPTRAQWTAGIGRPLRDQLGEWATNDADGQLLLERYRDYQAEWLEPLTVAYPAVRETLLWLRERGHPVGLVTSKGRGMTTRSLAHVGLSHAFDVIVTAESTDRHKPLPEPVWFALETLKLTPSKGVFVGDSVHDMFSGRAAGVTTVAATWGPFSRAELATTSPNWWLDSMADLPALAERLDRDN